MPTSDCLQEPRRGSEGFAKGALQCPVVLIPAYNPEPVLKKIVSELCGAREIRAIVIVNDGSRPEFRDLFGELARMERVHVLTHVVNRGKGAALKTGLNYIDGSFGDSVGAITADADGQHAVYDILQTAVALLAQPDHVVLGAREFKQGVPLRSKVGNIATKNILRAVTGQRISDTQTGLRGIPMGFIPTLMGLPPNGFDFELEVLLACKRAERPIREIAISTIYLEGNRSSHFNPFLDSMRIYFVLIRFAAVSLSTALLDNLVFFIAFHFSAKLLIAQALSRSLAGLYQYKMNKRNVFHSSVSDRLGVIRFASLLFAFGAVSYWLINLLQSRLGFSVMSAKLIAESLLFGLGFFVQREFVFAARAKPRHTPAETIADKSSY